MKKQYQRLFILLTLFTYTQAFDLEGIARSQLREHLRPYLNGWVADQTLPIGIFPAVSRPVVIVGAQYHPLLAIKGQITGSSPTLWLATNLGAALLFGGGLQGGHRQAESYNAMTLFLAYQIEQNQNAQHFSCQLTHVKGLADLHYRILSLGITQQWQLGRSQVHIGYFHHIVQSKLHISSTLGAGNYHTQKEYGFDCLQIASSIAIRPAWQLGVELNLGRAGQTVGLTCFYYL